MARSRLPLEIIKWNAISLIVFIVFGFLLDNWDRLIIGGIHATYFIVAALVLILGGRVVFGIGKQEKLNN